MATFPLFCSAKVIMAASFVISIVVAPIFSGKKGNSRYLQCEFPLLPMPCFFLLTTGCDVGQKATRRHINTNTNREKRIANIDIATLQKSVDLPQNNAL